MKFKGSLRYLNYKECIFNCNLIRLHNHLEVSCPEDVAKMEEEFAEVVRKRGPEFKFFQDQYGEHPEERAAKNVETNEPLGEVQTLTHIFTSLKEKV